MNPRSTAIDGLTVLSPPRLLRLLPAERQFAGWVYLPLGNRAFSRRTLSRIKDVNFLGIIADRRNVKTPPETAAALVRYEWPLAQGTLAVGADAKYSGAQYYCICDFSSSKIPAYTVGNARLAYTTARDRVEFSAYVNNFTDKIYKTVGFDFSGTTGSSLTGYGAPRWWGIGIQYNMKKRD